MRSIHIQLHYGDGEYDFALYLPQLMELEEICGYTDAQGNSRRKPILHIYRDLLEGCLTNEDGSRLSVPMAGSASAKEMVEPLRLGILGGNGGVVNGEAVKLNPVQAKQLVERYSHQRPLAESWGFSASIVAAAIEGYDPPKKDQPGDDPAPRKKRSSRAKSSATAP